MWFARIRIKGKDKWLGSFTDEIAAARAYDAHIIAKKLNKVLNFPGQRVEGHAVPDAEAQQEPQQKCAKVSSAALCDAFFLPSLGVTSVCDTHVTASLLAHSHLPYATSPRRIAYEYLGCCSCCTLRTT